MIGNHVFRRAVGWLAALMALIAAPVAANAEGDIAAVTSPNGEIVVTVMLNGEGRPAYRVTRAGKPLLGESRLGFILADAPKLERNFKLVDTSTAAMDEVWQQPWGEWRTIRNHYQELSVRLREATPLAREFVVRFRVYDYGLGFRYEFPDQAALGNVAIQEELTQFNVLDEATAWWLPAFEWNRKEYLYNRTPLREAGVVQMPLTLKTAAGLHLSFHEAALVDYPAMNLAKVEGQLLKAVLTPAAAGPKAVRRAPFTTPWRTLQISPDAAHLYNHNYLGLNLNEPNKLGDVSWVRPRKYMGIWWGMHLDTQSWATGPKHGATTAYAKQMIDFASKHGITGLLIEGWNEGWDGDWFANGETFSFTKAAPGFDLKAVADYGRAKGVTIVGHHETSGHVAHYEAQLDDAMRLYQSLGIDSVKTGYVADAGGLKVAGPDGKLRFEWHEGQASTRHHLKVVETAARHRIAVNPHEPVRDTGLRRTYPNWVSREGARGMEYNAWGAPKNPPEHEANLVFTRMLSGPFDFTPGVLSLRGRGGTAIESTLAKQLALYVVLYSPIQMVADLPEHYEAEQAAFQFIRDVAVDWDETRALAGAVGDYAVIARKARGTPEWFLGAVGDEQAREVTVRLDFLDAGRSYDAQIYRDADDADYRTAKRTAHVIETRRVRAGDALTLKLAPGGGQAIRFVPARR